MEGVQWHPGYLPMSAAHRCLHITELQLKIFTLVLDGCSDRTGKATLAVLARTSRLFYSCATEVLWATLDSFRPLVQCLPKDLWRIEQEKLVLQRHLSAHDWAIFYRYAWRVRALNGSSRVFPRKDSVRFLNSEVYRAFSFPPAFNSLLPRLTSLQWVCVSKEAFPFIRSLLTDRLTSLTLHLPTVDLSVSEKSILASFGTLCPNLKCFSISGCADQTHQVISDCILDLGYLEKLSCGRLSEGALVHLARLRSPTDVSFELPPEAISPTALHFLRYPAFNNIQFLKIVSSTLASLMPLTQTMLFAPKKVEFMVTKGAPSDALRDFFGGLSRCCCQGTLEEIGIRYRATPSASRDSQFTIETLRPLFLFRNLRALSLQAPYTMNLNNEAMKEMARSWPLLHSLELNVNCWYGTPVTPKGLIHLLRHCPMVTSLGFVVDFSPVDLDVIATKAPAHGFSHEGMEFALFGDSRIENPPSIAAFLSALMPHLALVEAWDSSIWEDDEDHDTYRARWTQVQSLLGAFNAVRKQGKRLGRRGVGCNDKTEESESDESSVEGQPEALGHTEEGPGETVAGGDAAEEGDNTEEQASEEDPGDEEASEEDSEEEGSDR
ncbi:hypothetical protein BV22DRAFT_1082616 [Leucogyrophana mollusca]|uniref:Uncharacterized protein n=1 Tax=Leucogyrophana mollusca TaxID=85980 RepID=A0ACB8BT13_9AGAM|nr:hypothetical protein BV22DRAFT_1082616 [Leucogyrophana mollusca]